MTSTPTDSQPIKVQVLEPGQYPRSSGVWLWPLLWLSLLLGSTAVGLWAATYMTRIPPLPNCDQISSFSADSERLYCVQVAAESGNPEQLIAAIELASSWNTKHPLYKDSNKLLTEWSAVLFEKAQAQVQQGALSQAVAWAEHIPARAENYQTAKGAIAAWKAEWQRGDQLSQQINQAIVAENWPQAQKALQDMKRLTSDYWLEDRHQILSAKVKKEQSAHWQLDAAEDLAAYEDIPSLSKALTLARDIDPQTQVWAEAKPLMDDWAAQLLQYGFQKWEQEDIEGAIEAIQYVPVDLAKAPEAQDLLYFAHAQRLAKEEKSDWLPSYGKLLNLIEATQAMQKISQESPFYQDAQTSLTEWRQKLEDLRELYFANLLAQFNQKPLLSLAIAEANQIGPDRPQRLQAQTLISHWHKQIERIEDRPYLVRAEQLAAVGDIKALQAGIKEAAKIKLGRALRIDSQTKIAAWTKRIQVIEDQPLMNQALAFAGQGELQKAIEAARQVEPGRALYEDAQTSIQTWISEIQIAEDRPILQRAQTLADQGRLSEAIGVASQVGGGRALYGEAQGAIATWASQREAILTRRRQQFSPDSTDNQEADRETE